MTPREWFAMVPLIALMVWMGTYTQSFLPAISPVNARYVVEQANVKPHPGVVIAKETVHAR
jgi:hypothetical protein